MTQMRQAPQDDPEKVAEFEAMLCRETSAKHAARRSIASTQFCPVFSGNPGNFVETALVAMTRVAR